MKLYELANISDEIEVWDEEIDIKQPVYVYPELTYENKGDEVDLYRMEQWFRNLEVTSSLTYSVCVNVFKEIKENWEHILEKMKNNSSYIGFLEEYGEDATCDEAIAEYVEDVFTILAIGFKKSAGDFCEFMEVE